MKKEKGIVINGKRFIRLSFREGQVVGWDTNGVSYTFKYLVTPRRKGKMTKIEKL